MNEHRRDKIPTEQPELGILGCAEVLTLAEEGYGVIPLVVRLEQMYTTGALYEQLRGEGPSFLLESFDTDERQGRYSFIGLDPDKVIRLEADGMYVNGVQHPFDDPYRFVDGYVNCGEVAPVVDLPPFFGGAAGLFGYDLVRYREPSIGSANEDPLGLPELAIMIPGTVIAVDHYKQEVMLIRNIVVADEDDGERISQKYDEAALKLAKLRDTVTSPMLAMPVDVDYPPLEFTSDFSKAGFKSAVERSREYCRAGDIFQVVPSRRLSSDKPVDANFAHETSKKLKRRNPSSYAFLFEFDDFQATGSSPETLLRVTGDHVEQMAIAGTRPRGSTPEEDRRLAEELLADPKENAEHVMLVDLTRNDLGKVCEYGSVVVTRQAEVETHSHVMHITSRVEGALRVGQRAIEAFANSSPAGTLSGAPKIRAMQIIDELEPHKRGFYGGGVGYIGFNGDLDTCIFIRSALVDRQGYVHVQAGAGIVVDSVAETEYHETEIKAAAPLAAIAAVGQSRAGVQHVAKEKLPRQGIIGDNHE